MASDENHERCIPAGSDADHPVQTLLSGSQQAGPPTCLSTGQPSHGPIATYLLLVQGDLHLLHCRHSRKHLAHPLPAAAPHTQAQGQQQAAAC